LRANIYPLDFASASQSAHRGKDNPCEVMRITSGTRHRKGPELAVSRRAPRRARISTSPENPTA
jgi:hypothetical protein